MSDTEIINSAVDNFMLLAEVPRPSHHEEMISAFLMGWAEEQGLSPVQDVSLNVMFDVPATEGMVISIGPDGCKGDFQSRYMNVSLS